MPLLIREYGHLVRAQPLPAAEDRAITVSSADYDFLESQLFALDSDNEYRFFLKPSVF
jgi:hypothetical protein